MEVLLRPKKIILFLGTIICLLVLGNIVSMFAMHYLQPLPNSTLHYMIGYFDVASENNFPTYFSTLQLFFCAAVLFVIASTRRRQSSGDFWQWLGLGIIFLFLSLDESLMIHEVVAIKIRHNVTLPGYLFYAWVIPYSVFALVVLAIYIPFLIRLPASVRKQMFLAGAIFVLGALGLEAIESWYFTSTGGEGPVYMLFTAVEETMEMGGILLFLHSLLHYLNLQYGSMSLILTAERGHAKQNAQRGQIISEDRPAVPQDQVQPQTLYRSKRQNNKNDEPALGSKQ